MENEIEELSSKKKPDEEKLSELAEALGNHRFHVEKMELLERLLENEVVEPSDIDNIKDDIQYYLGKDFSDCEQFIILFLIALFTFSKLTAPTQKRGGNRTFFLI